MRFAFGIVNLFPGGGLQRDCVDIARGVRQLGHDVTIFTMRKRGEFADELPLHILTTSSFTNHQRQRSFSDKFLAASDDFDLRVGFDKLEGLDVLYCSDPSMQARVDRNPILTLLPRYRQFIRLEKESFSQHEKTKILLLSEIQRDEYRVAWATEPSRLTVLPPTISRGRRRPEFRADGTRTRMRTQLDFSERDWVWLVICVQPRIKGLDRTIRALQQFDDARLMIVGLDEAVYRSKDMVKLAHRLDVANRISWLGHREDIPELMAAADLLVHPARYDTTGTVILEGIVNGLPVITTSACGYARHVTAADAGVVLSEPFSAQSFGKALELARDPARAAGWSASAVRYGDNPELYKGKSRAVELIVAAGEQGRERALKRSA